MRQFENPKEPNHDALSSIELTQNTKVYDAASKALLKNVEILAIILQHTITEYRGYTKKEIMSFIEADTISERTEVSPGRTNATIKGDPTESNVLNEKVTFFDILFQAKNPLLSSERLSVNLHIDIEPQQDYRPGYPIEKRGIYYLAREISSQLGLLTGKTNYGALEKCYSIWICTDKIPAEEKETISTFCFINTENVGNVHPKAADYDLMQMAIIRLGDLSEQAHNQLIDFLNLLFYRRKNRVDRLGSYINFHENPDAKKEVTKMSGIVVSAFRDGVKEGHQKGRQEGRQEGRLEGRENAFLELVKDGLLSIPEAAKRLSISEAELKSLL